MLLYKYNHVIEVSLGHKIFSRYRKSRYRKSCLMRDYCKWFKVFEVLNKKILLEIFVTAEGFLKGHKYYVFTSYYSHPLLNVIFYNVISYNVKIFSVSERLP